MKRFAFFVVILMTPFLVLSGCSGPSEISDPGKPDGMEVESVKEMDKSATTTFSEE